MYPSYTKKKEEERVKKGEEVTERQEKEFGEEVRGVQEAREAREDWRQERHAEKLQMEEQKRKETEEKLRQEEQKQKKEKKEEEQAAFMADLHKRAVEKRVREKIQGARIEEGRQKEQTTNREQKNVKNVDDETVRSIEHIEHEARRKKELLQRESEQKRAGAEESFKDAKKNAQALSREKLRIPKDETIKRQIRLEEHQAVMQADAERKRILFGLEESLQQQSFDIDTQARRLIDELRRNEAAKEERIHREADVRRTEAEKRREGTEKWFGVKIEKKE